MIVLRQSRLKDLDAFITFAEEASLGITSLPPIPHILEQRLKRAERGFRTGMFLFSLEKDGEIIGTSGVTAKRGKQTPLFTYQVRAQKVQSRLLSINRAIDVLHFHRVRSRPTEIGSLYLRRDFRSHNLGQLLSYSRFLFIHAFRSHFAPMVMAELRGVSNPDGSCPFWSAIGAHFFGINFQEADHLRFTQPRCIEHLFPRTPIYRDLLPFMAQRVIGKPHQNTEAAATLLERQGFYKSDMIDLFDAGPHYYAARDSIAAIKQAKQVKVAAIQDLDEEECCLIANRKKAFRATEGQLKLHGQGAIVSKEVAEALEVRLGDEVTTL